MKDLVASICRLCISAIAAFCPDVGERCATIEFTSPLLDSAKYPWFSCGWFASRRPAFRFKRLLPFMRHVEQFAHGRRSLGLAHLVIDVTAYLRANGMIHSVQTGTCVPFVSFRISLSNGLPVPLRRMIGMGRLFGHVNFDMRYAEGLAR